GANPQRCVFRISGAEHPLIATNRAHATPHLVSESLKGERAVARCERAGEGRAGFRGGLRGQENIKCFFEPALVEVGVTRERNQRAGSRYLARGNVKTMDGVE